MIKIWQLTEACRLAFAAELNATRIWNCTLHFFTALRRVIVPLTYMTTVGRKDNSGPFHVDLGPPSERRTQPIPLGTAAGHSSYPFLALTDNYDMTYPSGHCGRTHSLSFLSPYRHL